MNVYVVYFIICNSINDILPRLSITHSSLLAYDCLCNINYFDISTLPFLTRILAITNTFLQDPNQYFPFNFFHVLLLILRSLHYRLKSCYDSLLDVPLTLLHQYLPFIKELIHSYSILFQRCILFSLWFIIRFEWINTTLWTNSSSYHRIIKWICYCCKDLFKYTIWRHSTTIHFTLSFLLKRILLFLYSLSCFSLIVAFFGLSSEDCEICTICIRLYSLSSSLYHQDIIHALCGCCRDGRFILHSLHW